MIHLIAKNKLYKFKETKLHNSYHFDTSDINNFKFSEFIDALSQKELYEHVAKIVKKFMKNKYKEFYREELADKLDFCDMEILYLLKFYKESYHLSISNEEHYFPLWIFTYNLLPLKNEIHKIIKKSYEKIEPNYCKWYLNETRTFSALEVSYLLHYFILSSTANKME